MNKIKDSFLIQDLEILSGIKAHTIRIWEKRYELLNPERVNRNIRIYSLSDLQKLLNVSILYNNGYKISKVSKLTIDELHETARNISLESIDNNYHVNALIVSMYSFDSDLFDQIYSELIEKMSFESLFFKIYIPLLDHIGVLWQTDAIKPAHEHFISNLIIGKVTLNTASIKIPKNKQEKTYVLFLPVGELHSLGLLFLNYCLKLRGKHTVFLGGSIPFSNLETLSDKFSNIKWICSFVIDRPQEEKVLFLEEFDAFLKNTNGQAVIVGRIWADLKKSYTFDDMKFYTNFKEMSIFN